MLIHPDFSWLRAFDRFGHSRVRSQASGNERGIIPDAVEAASSTAAWTAGQWNSDTLCISLDTMSSDFCVGVGPKQN
jgi:hypothetical protein